MPNQDLQQYIQQSRQAGKTDEEIRQELWLGGSTKEDINKEFEKLEVSDDPEKPKIHYLRLLLISLLPVIGSSLLMSFNFYNYNGDFPITNQDVNDILEVFSRSFLMSFIIFLCIFPAHFLYTFRGALYKNKRKILKGIYLLIILLSISIVLQEVSKLFFVPFSFPAGQLIAAHNGYLPIEDIKIGDLVLSYNTKTKRTEYNKVAWLHSRYDDNAIEINNTLIVTPEHPFALVEIGGNVTWRKAKNIKIGDCLFEISGECLGVTSVKALKIPRQKVYNFHVDGTENYFIIMDNKLILVHNKIVL